MSQSRVRCDSEKPLQGPGPDALLHRQDPRTALSILRRPAGRAEAGAGADHEPGASGFRFASSPSSSSSPSNAARCSCKARICNQYKSRKTKSYAFLLVFVCAAVLQAASAAPVTASGQRLILHSSQYRQRHHQQLLLQQRQQAPPPPTQAQTHRHHHLHHRSAPNMPEDRGICEEAQTLEQLLKQVNLSYDYIRNKLLDYTDNQHDKTPEDLHVDWIMHKFQLQHPLSAYLLRDFEKVPDASHYPHLAKPLTRETVVKHMEDVYITLKILDKAFAEVRDDRKRKKNQLMHDLLPGKDFGKIEAFIEDAHRYVAMELQVAIEAMRKLNINLPPFNDPVKLDNRQMRDWLLISEHLSVMQYLRMLYELLLSKCF